MIGREGTTQTLIDIQRVCEKERQKDRQRDRRKDRETDRQIETQRKKRAIGFLQAD